MSQKLTIFVDLDDTLVDTKQTYDQACESAFAYLRKHYDVTRSFEYFRGMMGVHNATYRGKKIDAEIRTPQSLVDAAHDITSNLNALCAEKIRKIGEKIFQIPPQAKKDAQTSLMGLHAKILRHRPNADVQYIVLTQGRDSWQKEKFDSMPADFKNIFSELIIVPDKSTATYQRIIAERELDPNQCIMIGDKESADINPALNAGMHAYHIPVRKAEFASINDQAPIHGDRYNKCKSMQECIRHISKRFLGLRFGPVIMKQPRKGALQLRP